MKWLQKSLKGSSEAKGIFNCTAPSLLKKSTQHTFLGNTKLLISFFMTHPKIVRYINSEFF
jgi:hypothetical protein